MDLALANGHTLSFTSQRKLGRIELVHDQETVTNDLGPDALSVSKKKLHPASSDLSQNGEVFFYGPAHSRRSGKHLC